MKLRKLPKCPKCGHDLTIQYITTIIVKAVGIDDNGLIIYEAKLDTADYTDYTAVISCDKCGYVVEDKYPFNEISDLPNEVEVSDEYIDVDIDDNLRL